MSLYECDICGHLQEFKFLGKSHPPRVIGIQRNKLCPTCTREFGHTDKSSVITTWHRAKDGDTADTCTCTICRQDKYPWLVVMKDGTRYEFEEGPMYSDCGIHFKRKDGSNSILSSPMVLYVVNTRPSTPPYVMTPQGALYDVVVTLTNGEKISARSEYNPISKWHHWWFSDVPRGREYCVPATSAVWVNVK